MSGLIYAVLAVSLSTASFDVSEIKLCQLENSKKSIEACTKLIRNTASSTKIRTGAYIHRGIAYFKTRKSQAAINDFSNAIQLNPTDAVAYTRRGHVHSALKLYGLAVDDYNKALNLDSKTSGAQTGLGIVFFQKGQHIKAIESYSEALRLDPKNGLTLARRALTYLTIGEPHLGLVDIELAVKLRPGHTGIQRFRRKIFSAVEKLSGIVAEVN